MKAMIAEIFVAVVNINLLILDIKIVPEFANPCMTY